MTTMRLKTEHPLCKKLEQIFNLMEKLDIKIEVTSYDIFIIHEDKRYKLIDNDSGGYPMNDFPPYMEYKLTYEKEDED